MTRRISESKEEYNKRVRKYTNERMRRYRAIPENKEREHKLRKMRSKSKNVFLEHYYIENHEMGLVQPIGEDGNLIGVGKFIHLKDPFRSNKHTLDYLYGRQGISTTQLNKEFDGCDGHHLYKDVIAFVPRSLHRSVWHNLKTGKGMDEINGKILCWVGEHQNENR